MTAARDLDRVMVSPVTLDQSMVPIYTAATPDARLMHPVVWGLGFILAGSRDIYGTKAHPGAVGHAGGGAAMGYADRDRGLAVALLTNRMLGRESWDRYRRVADGVDRLVEEPA